MATKKVTEKGTAKKLPVLKKKYSGLVFNGKIYRNPLSDKDVNELAKHPLGDRLFE